MQNIYWYLYKISQRAFLPVWIAEWHFERPLRSNVKENKAVKELLSHNRGQVNSKGQRSVICVLR